MSPDAHRHTLALTLLPLSAVIVGFGIYSHQLGEERDGLKEDLESANEQLRGTRGDILSATETVYEAKRKLDRVQHKNTVAITAVYEHPKAHEEEEFHRFCDEHVSDALYYAGFPHGPPLPVALEVVELMSYGDVPKTDKSGYVTTCRWSVIANRESWCRRYGWCSP